MAQLETEPGRGPSAADFWASNAEGDEHLVAAVGAADAGEAELQVAATEEAAGDFADDRAGSAVLLGITLFVRAFELGQISRWSDTAATGLAGEDGKPKSLILPARASRPSREREGEGSE
jgi:hypothetical protein